MGFTQPLWVGARFQRYIDQLAVNAIRPAVIRAGKGAFENSATRAFGPAGFLEQDDSENWCEIQKLLKGHRARNSKLCLEMGLGQEKRRDDGIPGITNYIFSETAARGMYQRWADLLSSESWQEVLDKTAAYQQEVMK